MSIKAIPTTYAGCRFRSRLEARWACFFDAMGWAWDFEPEGYQTKRWYLPDFRLRHPTGDRWFEVKPYLSAPDAEPEESRWVELSHKSGMPLHVAYGMHRPGDGCGDPSRPRRHAGRAVLPTGESVLIPTFWTESPYDGAWKAANGARFEHGESGG